MALRSAEERAELQQRHAHHRSALMTFYALGSSSSPSAAWKAAVVAAGGTVSVGRQTLVDNLITGLKSDGVWTKLDRLWLFAAENTQSALIDLVALATATAVNSPAFAIDRGYTGDAASSYINTNIAPSGGTQFQQNSGALSGYIRNARTTTNNYGAWGANWLATSATRFYPKYGDGNLYAENNSSTFTQAVGPANVSGIWVVSRTTSVIQTCYRNGSSFATSGVATSGAPDTANIFVLANQDGAGNPTDLSADQIASFSMGAGLDATQAANHTTRIQTYMTAVGA